MTGVLFVSLITAFSIITPLVTQAIKKALNDKLANNVIVLIVSIVVGWGGGAVAYIFLDIPFNDIKNIIALVLMAPIVWVASMTSYDKVIQTIEQIIKIKNVKVESKKEDTAAEDDGK